MTVTEPLPGVYGKADWEDYSHYWREADAEWIQDRLVLRVVNEGDLEDLDHTPGGLVYNAFLDQLQLRSSAGGYKTLTPLPGTLQTAEAGGRTTIQHDDAGVGQGIVFSATEIEITDDFKVQGGVLTVNSTGVSVKTAGDPVKLTTVGTGTATNLVSDRAISAPGLALTGGALSALGRAATFGSLTVETTAVVTGALTAGVNSVIGGVAFRTGGYMEAPQGIVSIPVGQTVGGYLNGDANGAKIRSYGPGGPGTAIFQVSNNDHMYFFGTGVFMNPTLYIRGGKAINYYSADDQFRAYISPSFYAAPTPDVTKYPEGTIWIS